MTQPTLYEFAGGDPAFRALAEAQYRRCLADPILTEAFGKTADPEHAPRLAAWLGEVFGGPPVYTERYGGHAAMIEHHLGGAFTESQRARFVEVTLEAADEVRLPADPAFRQRLRAYFEWGSQLAVAYSQPGATVPHGEPAPRWGWETPHTPAAAGPEATPTGAGSDSGAAAGGRTETPSFERDIKPLFREFDVRSMAFAFDLQSYADVRAHSAALLSRLEAGSMPCDGRWPDEHLALFRRWMSADTPR